MKLAIISDIHGNAVALENVLEDISSKGISDIVVLGDLIFRGPEPRKVLNLLRSTTALVLRGNTDEWITRGIKEEEVPASDFKIMNLERQWTKNQLTEEELIYLDSLPLECSLSLSAEISIHCFHGTPEDPFEVILPSDSVDVFRQRIMLKKQASVYAYAHTHHPLLRYIDGKCIINPGGVGYTFDGYTQSSYAIVEEYAGQLGVSIQRVNYDVERVADLYQQLSYPNAELMKKVVREGVHPYEINQKEEWLAHGS
ncbi:metallophosphoesterase family protein [Paenibacillus sp. GCM10012307]|uniref:Metallophosphoesterase family protein n=1 Tax=Paenibacillus roseus TaxID=2798579 RepID=A0A934MWK0_9BACL|nr:metallophosphoesterase family protein [Paenibacillus roseus]MBJ6363222.1 metallophosphoesterase family protein [Paenibacillus roseus]